MLAATVEKSADHFVSFLAAGIGQNTKPYAMSEALGVGPMIADPRPPFEPISKVKARSSSSLSHDGDAGPAMPKPKRSNSGSSGGHDSSGRGKSKGAGSKYQHQPKVFDLPECPVYYPRSASQTALAGSFHYFPPS